MTNDQYGTYQTPSSRPPEPPYRADASETSSTFRSSATQPANYQEQQSHQPDFSGLDTPGNTQTMGGVGGSTERVTTQTYAPQYSPQHSAPKPQGSGGAGKSFLFGFLGALVACAIALGGFGIWQSTAAKGSAASTTLGATDSSVINAVEDGKTLAEAVAAKALPSVVAIYNYQQASTSGYGFGYGATNNSSGALQAAGMGSGVMISSDGYILTNYHVVEGAAKLTVKVGEEERDATYVGGDNSSDVAVVKIEDTSNLTAADIGNSDDLVIGEWVMTVGAPLGLEQSVATGVVSATNRSQIMNDSSSSDLYSYYYGTSAQNYTYYPNMIQTDAVINPGNSGGALVDSDGKLIGINTMISSYSGDYAGVGFAIPINYAIGLAQDIIAGKTPAHSMLGVSISSVTSSNAQRYGLSTTSGAYVSAIAEGTGAASSDLQVGDIITAIDGKKVSSATDVTLDVRAHNPGETVTVTVNRNGETKDIPVVLSSDENASTNSNNGNNQNNQGQGQGNGNGSGSGNGSGRTGSGYTDEQLLELLKKFGY